jgi:predicted nuclease of predicted toxin-antitoxin system
MRFLIDENLSPTLVDLARQRGHEALAVRDLGLLNAKDWTLLERVQNEDWTLVTNNVGEFRKRYARKTTLHAGVVFLVDVDAGRDVQKLAFAAALDEIGVNAVEPSSIPTPNQSTTFANRNLALDVQSQ